MRLAQQAPMVQPGLRVSPVLPVPKVQSVLLDRPGLLVPPALRVRKVWRALLDLPEPLARPVHKVLPVPRDQPVPKAQQVPKVRPARRAAAACRTTDIFNTDPAVIAIEASIAFSSNGALSGVTHAPGTSSIVSGSAGLYDIAFQVSGVEPNQFALFVNGAPAPGTVFGSGAGTQQTNGRVLLTLAAGDVVNLVNHSSAAAVTLQTLAGGTQSNVNASMLILKVAD